MNDQFRTATFPTRRLSLIDRTARSLITDRLASIRRGLVLMTDGESEISLGESGHLAATMSIHDGRFYRNAVLGGTLSVAESWIQGEWDSDDLTTLLRIFARNLNAAGRLNQGIAMLKRTGSRFFHWLHANTRTGSRRNIGAHYDLGNDFFRLWLDDSMAYSSAIFPTPDATLLEASHEKFDRVCRKLRLTPDDHLLEIGTGWGGLAVHAARNYGCRVTTTTISRQQAEIAEERIQAAGVSDRVSLLRQDYRELTGQYDKLVSIEMIEAVGHRYLDTYLKKCGQLLRPEGSLLLQAIVMPECRHEQYLRSVDFIQRYVFPGGCLPSVASILESAGRTTDLRFVHAEDFAPHYAETLRRWRLGFETQLNSIRQMGYSEQFIRLWKYYLSYCEAVFLERQAGVVHLQLDKPQCSRDPLELSRYAVGNEFSHSSGGTHKFFNENRRADLSGPVSS